MRGGSQIFEVAKAVKDDSKAQKHLKDGVIRLIKDLRIK
jgi:hypothetical protein